MGAVEEQNKAVIHKLVDAFNNQDREAFDSCYANPIVINTQHDSFTMSHDEHWEQSKTPSRSSPTSMRNSWD